MKEFVYTIYIKATPEQVWDALTQREWTRRYWVGTHQESEWTPGAEWKLMIPDGRVGDSGRVMEADRPRKLVLAWRNEFLPELRGEAHTRCTYELVEEPKGVTKLTLTHVAEREDSKTIEGLSQGWPGILSSLKSLLETGVAMPGTTEWPEGF